MPKRIVTTEFWTDGKVVDTFSPEDKYFMLYLLTNPHTTQLGIYHLSPKIAAFELGYSVEAVRVLIDRFENKYGIIKWAEQEQELAIKNYLLHSIVKGGKPVYDQLTREMKMVKSKELVKYVMDYLADKDGLNSTVLSFINNNSDNANANANAISYHDTPTNRERFVDGRYNHILDIQFTLGMLPTGYQVEKFTALFAEVGPVVFHRALEKAARANARNYNYVESAARGIAEGKDFEKAKEPPKDEGYQIKLTPEEKAFYEKWKEKHGA